MLPVWPGWRRWPTRVAHARESSFATGSARPMHANATTVWFAAQKWASAAHQTPARSARRTTSAPMSRAR
eukprot:7707603-Pyramimonas_sp.AAC.1